MFVTLQITSGPLTGRKAHLRAGQTLKVGRTEWADFSVPPDAQMAEVHFALACHAGACTIRDLSATTGLIVNGAKVSEAVVRAGDVIEAGTTKFAVRIEEPTSPGAAATATATGVGAAAVAVGAAGATGSGFEKVVTPLAIEVCKRLSLDAPAQALLTDKQNCKQYFELLVSQELFNDAARFLGQALPKREAIWWGAVCVRAYLEKKLTTPDRTAVEAAEKWVVEPKQEHCRVAEKAAEATRHETAAGWVAAATFWSGDSMAPPDLPAVPPKDTLPGQGVYVAVNMTATGDDPRSIPERFRTCLQLGAAVADGKNRWPEKK
jgi:pSer/pThr/pTyr-binding forkhead associated (FHA) protein